jgi:hypothetical protein
MARCPVLGRSRTYARFAAIVTLVHECAGTKTWPHRKCATRAGLDSRRTTGVTSVGTLGAGCESVVPFVEMNSRCSQRISSPAAICSPWSASSANRGSRAFVSAEPSGDKPPHKLAATFRTDGLRHWRFHVISHTHFDRAAVEDFVGAW